YVCVGYWMLIVISVVYAAVAELLDNAVDEVCLAPFTYWILRNMPLRSTYSQFCCLVYQIHNGATFVKVDKINNLKDNSPVLLFQGT
ncbi:hypothetical protein BHE74_00042620, partial [Ensete ventricosum]